MSRAKGRNTARKPDEREIKPNTPEGRQFGISDRVQGTPSPIPGGQNHLSNAPAVRHTVPVPPSDAEIGIGNAHGVAPGTHTNAERAEMERGPNTVHRSMPRPQHTPRHERPQPIPVVVVQDHHNEVIRSAAPHKVTVPGTGNDPIRLCGRDVSRKSVMLLNESTTNDIRFAQRPSDLNNTGGALLPYPSNSYLKIDTQDELYAISATATAASISIIQIFEREM